MRLMLWAMVLIISLVCLDLSIRILALKNVSISFSLTIRGLSCLFLVVIFARQKNFSLWPNSATTQCLRAVIAGLALTLFTMSYKWLTASSVALLSNIDVPLLVILGPFVGLKTHSRIRNLAVGSILILICYVLMLNKQPHYIYGLSSLLTGCVLLSFGYFFIKKSMEEENHAIAILTPALSITIFGLIQSIPNGFAMDSFSFELLGITILSGFSMFLAYIATMRLYLLTDIANAEFPTLISSLIIFPLEKYFLNELLPIHFFIISLFYVIMTYFILLEKNKFENAIS